MMWLLIAMALPTIPATGGTYDVHGWCLEDGEGLEDLDIIVTNEMTDESLTTTTDEDGYWEVDLDDLEEGWAVGDTIGWESWEDLEPNGWGSGNIINNQLQVMGFIQNKAGQGPSTCYYEIDALGVALEWDTYPNPPQHFWGALQIQIVVKMKFEDKRPQGHGTQNDNALKVITWWFDVESFDQPAPPKKKYTSAPGADWYNAPPKNTGWKNVVINMNPAPPGMHTWVLTYHWSVTNTHGQNPPYTDSATTTGHAQFCFITHGGLPNPGP